MKTRRPRPRRETSRPALAAAAHPWEDVFASFADAVVVTDEETRVVLFNPAAEELIGLPQHRVIGQPCASLFAETPLIDEMVRHVQSTGMSESQGEAQLQQRGRSLGVRIACLPVWDARDRIRGTTIVIHDLTYQKRLEEAARRNESLARLGTLVAGLAHEIKNPLAGIKGAAQLLQQRLNDRRELHEYTTVIGREVDRLSTLVQDLLTLGAPPKPDLGPLNIHAVIQHVLAVMEGELTVHGIQVRLHFDPSLPHVAGDHAQLSQVFLNLLKNAIEASIARPTADAPPLFITITTRMETDFHVLRAQRRSDKFLRVEIADQGTGIDPTTSRRLFEPFFTTKPRGTGLGLAISHRIVSEHGGIIRAEPNRPAGTVVTVTLPVVPGVA
jgi:two-component system nitrogen regulation sensor histidine kinase GlnL